MNRIVSWAQGFALAVGGPGLFVIAFLDASFLSLPEINDILVVWMVTRHKERLLYYASMATLGSMAGCFVLYWLAWKGGEAVLRRWFHERHIEKGDGDLPAPRRARAAGARPSCRRRRRSRSSCCWPASRGCRWRKFALAIAVGRGVRYLVEGWLAVMYGEAAISYVRDHGKEAALVAAVAVLVAGVAYIWWQSRRGPSGG